MKKHELLAPVGSYEAMLAAVQNGCDAIYVGGKKFGARAFASNFDEETMAEAIGYCHVYNVKVYVTVNTLVYEEEWADAMAYIDFLYGNGVDAVIVQDFGMLKAIREQYPELEIHASTQMHVHNIEGVRLLWQMGVKRVVLSRECHISQIRAIHEACPDMELEVFVYGALCVSYSGQCLMSSMIGNRSGNRGECAQACRLPYTLYKKVDQEVVPVEGAGSYLLSPRDLNVLSKTATLLDSGVTSLKVEGRMKRPEYVAMVVSVLREAMEAYAAKQEFVVCPDTEEQLKKLFNRGFTAGHIFGARGSDLMNATRPNHIGIPLGKVIHVNEVRGRIGIALEADIAQGDGIRFLNATDGGFMVNWLYRNDLLAANAKSGERVEVSFIEGVQIGDSVVKTSDVDQLRSLRGSYEKPMRKMPVSMRCTLACNTPMQLVVEDGVHMVSVQSEECAEAAINRPISDERLTEQLSKCKDTPFTVVQVSIVNDGISIISISQINAMRRAALDKLIEAKMTAYTRPCKQQTSCIHPTYTEHPQMLTCTVQTQAQLNAAREMKIACIYVAEPYLYFAQADKTNLVCASKRVNEANKTYACDALLIRELGALTTVSTKHMYIDDAMNITNAHSLAFFYANGARTFTLSHELTRNQMKNIIDATGGGYELEVHVYGRMETMLMKHCIINTAEIDSKRTNCQLCRQSNQYYLKDRKGESFPILCNQDCMNHVLFSKNLILIDALQDLKQLGIHRYRLNFTIESALEVQRIIQAFQTKLAGEYVNLNVDSGTTGYYWR